jgi:flagellar basal body-associated protein FliL
MRRGLLRPRHAYLHAQKTDALSKKIVVILILILILILVSSGMGMINFGSSRLLLINLFEHSTVFGKFVIAIPFLAIEIQRIASDLGSKKNFCPE